MTECLPSLNKVKSRMKHPETSSVNGILAPTFPVDTIFEIYLRGITTEKKIH